MQFHLNHTPPRFGFEITHAHRIMLAGSCFAENIGAILKTYRFQTLCNPSGILFNPASVLRAITRALHPQAPNPGEIISRDGVFLSYEHHSSIHADTEAQLLQKITEIDKRSADFLLQGDFLIITFGTAYVYRHRLLNQPVSNCHKQPHNLFQKELLAVSDITRAYTGLLAELQQINPALKIIFTVSPVKYLRDGLIENNLSKSTLLLAVSGIVSANQNCFYFPAYELVTDDLRDYRFYSEDKAHPNDQAIRYVWEKFAAASFGDKTREAIGHLEKINRALAHRPLGLAGTGEPRLTEFITQQQEIVKKLAPEIRF